MHLTSIHSASTKAPGWTGVGWTCVQPMSTNTWRIPLWHLNGTLCVPPEPREIFRALVMGNTCPSGPCCCSSPGCLHLQHSVSVWPSMGWVQCLLPLKSGDADWGEIGPQTAWRPPTQHSFSDSSGCSQLAAVSWSFQAHTNDRSSTAISCHLKLGTRTLRY